MNTKIPLIAHFLMFSITIPFQKASAQIDTTFVIDTICTTYHNTCSNSDFINRCPSGWTPSNGTPEIIYQQTGPPLHKYTHGWFALMNADSLDGSEGMFIPFTFLSGQSYTVTVYYDETGANGSLSMYAANGLTEETIPPSNCQDPLPMNSTNHWILTTSTEGNYLTAFNTIVPDSTYTQLWMHSNFISTKVSGGNDSSTAAIDVEEIYILSNCYTSAPTNLDTTNDNTTLSWSAVSGASSYLIDITDTHNGTPKDTQLTSTTNQVNFCPLGSGDNIAFTVAGVCANGATGSRSTPFSFTYAPAALTVPPNPTYTSSTDLLSWGAVGGAASYNLEIKNITTGGGIQPYGGLGTSVTGSTLELTQGDEYEFAVQAYNSCLSSSYTGWVEFTEPLPCNMPTINSITVPSNGNLEVTFTGPSSGATVTNFNINLYEYTPGTGTTAHNGVGTTSPVTISVPVVDGSYLVSMQSVCGTSTSSYTAQCCGSPLIVWSLKSKTDSTRMTADGSNSVTPGLKIYPNPTSSQLNLEYTANHNGQVDVTVMNSVGNVLIHKILGTSTGQNNLVLDSKEMPTGLYIVKVIDGSNIYIRKVLVAK